VRHLRLDQAGDVVSGDRFTDWDAETLGVPRRFQRVVVSLWVPPLPAKYTVSCADTPEAVAADLVDPDCGWHVSQTYN
jgi:hypothetical protein